MDFNFIPPVQPANSQIPADLFVSKKHPGLTHGDLGFADASGNLVFTVNTKSPKSALPRRKRVLLDASGNPIFSMYRNDNGSWQGFKGNDNGENKELMIFRVERTLNTLSRRELEVFFAGENLEGSKSEFKVKGFPFQKSCSIYRANSIVAQTSLMYKLRQILVGRSRFRLTIFPGFVDHALVVALIVIFLYGNK